MTGPADFVFTLDLSLDERTLLTGASDDRRSCGTWPPENGRQLSRITWDGSRWCELARWGCSPRRLGRGREYPRHHDGGRSDPRQPRGGFLALAFTPDGRHMVAGTELGLLRVWDAVTWDS